MKKRTKTTWWKKTKWIKRCRVMTVMMKAKGETSRQW
ncbi:hypothetical protein AWRI1631_72190 [Saccharomyces cerevisiae AWRI1631]|uniref:Uncharacterized protein n=1 Tax=Saccharomyces cerevisiae (strain AWRI1631) TaxID=545124 RepID=B5VIU2_YEAS6|nr:hypothetical protein AWRI1631_72190 [Saccharomyces cerevisiae AWRI1631]